MIMFGAWKKVMRRNVRVRRVNHTYLEHKEQARALIQSRLVHLNQSYQLIYHRVAIRDQRRCWGSCSSKGNLNFSYKLLFLPPCLRDYIIVHELCHLRVLNHSSDFWSVVAEVMPDYNMRALALHKLERTVGTAVRNLQALTHNSCQFCVDLSPAVHGRATPYPVLKEISHSDVVTGVTSNI